MVTRSLPATISLPWQRLAPVALFSVGASLAVLHLLIHQDRPWAAVALLAAPLALRWPLALIAGSLVLMLAYIDTGGADQTMLSLRALDSLLAGESPWRIYHFETWSNPFAYGPASMLTGLAWPVLEIASAIGLLVLLSRVAPVTMGLMAGLPIFVNLAFSGVNDYTPALLTVGALLLLRDERMRAGLVTLALAAAVKPYAAAWFLPAIGLTGWPAVPWLLGVSALLWLPFAGWLPDYLAMTREAANITGYPPTRWLAIPLGLASLVARSWTAMVLLGSGIFAAVLLFGSWASLGYLIVLIPALGVALEHQPSRRIESRTMVTSVNPS